MPALVGLAVLDSFALQTPMFTTTYHFHSPEIEYLKNGFNGVMTDNDEVAYSNSIIKTFSDSEYLGNLVAGCKSSDSLHTVEKMVHNFKNGIIGCLNQ